MVIWSVPARKDLKSIHEYISLDSEYYAKKVSEEFLSKVDKLLIFPKMGRVVPELELPYVRELLIYSYRIIYELREGNIEVLAIVHGKQDFSNIPE